MTMLSDRDRQTVQKEFESLTSPVKLTVFSQELGSDTCRDTELLVREVVNCSEKLSMQVANLVLEREKADAYGVDRVPAIVVEGAEDYGIRFYGLPGGYEFSNLIDAVVVASSGQPALSAETGEALAKVTTPIHIQVFTTPT